MHLAEPHRAGFVATNRTRLRVWEWGEPGDPVVLLLHGGWDHGRMWDGLAPDLAALGFHVVAPDARGHGDSGRLSLSGAFWPMFLLDVAGIVDHFGGRPVRVVGHSFGGGVTLAFTSAFPELVERAVNIDGLGPPPEMMLVQDHAAMAAQWLADADRLATEPQREYPSPAEMARKRKEINTRLPLEWCEHLVEHGTRRGPAGGWVWKSDPNFRLGSPGPFTEETLLASYRVISRPVLVLTGREADQWSFLTAADRDRRLDAIAGAEHQAVDGAGHYVHVEQPDAVVAHVARFFG
ncbi:MAG: alpha/beta hydrolase [Acidimicrobiales bacterium]|nr:alpha/beta hydrolase [Acidimicrobiales bacterium]